MQHGQHQQPQIEVLEQRLAKLEADAAMHAALLEVTNALVSALTAHFPDKPALVKAFDVACEAVEQGGGHKHVGQLHLLHVARFRNALRQGIALAG